MVRFDEIPEYLPTEVREPARVSAAREASCRARCGTWVSGGQSIRRCSDCLASRLVYAGIVGASAIVLALL